MEKARFPFSAFMIAIVLYFFSMRDDPRQDFSR